MNRTRVCILTIILVFTMFIEIYPLTGAFAASGSDFTIENGILQKYTGSDSNVIIPNGVKSIGKFAFDSCTMISVTIPNGVTSISNKAFVHCANLTNVIIPTGVTSIGEDAFSQCVSLKSISIPNSVTFIGNRAFYGCTALTSITIPDKVTSIGISTFWGCQALTDITLSGSVKSIGSHAFSYCTNLTNITIPDGVTSIGDKAFAYCNNLTKVTIPGSVTKIASDAFTNTQVRIYGEAGMYAQTYAENSNHKFYVIGTEDDSLDDIIEAADNYEIIEVELPPNYVLPTDSIRRDGLIPYTHKITPGKWSEEDTEGFMNSYGDVVMGGYKRGTFSRVGAFRDERIGFNNGSGLWGAVDMAGNVVIEPKYTATLNDGGVVFTDGLAIVLDKSLGNSNVGSEGVIDVDGNAVIPFGEYKFQTGYFRDGAVIASKDNKYFILKTDGEVIPLKYTTDTAKFLNVFWDGWISFQITDADGNVKHGVMDTSGKEIVSPIYDYVESGSGDHYKYKYIPVKLNGKQGIVDEEGKVIIPIKYDYADLCTAPEHRDLAIIKQDGKYGAVNTNGDIVVAIKYDYASGIKGWPIMWAQLNGKAGFIDLTTGKEITPFVYEVPRGYVLTTQPWNDMLFVKMDRGLWGTIDRTGNTVIQPRYRDVPNIYWHEHFAITNTHGSEYLIDRNGKIHSQKYSSLYPLSDTILVGYKDKAVDATLNNEVFYIISIVNKTSVAKK